MGGDLLFDELSLNDTMKRQLEIATIKANSTAFHGWEIFWILSKNQLELLFKELDMFSSSPSGDTAKYQDVMLPVINLENYYGLEVYDKSNQAKYLVVRSVNEKKELVKLIVEIPQKYTLQKLTEGLDPLESPVIPQNGENVLGIYSLAPGQLGVVPDFARISQSMQI